MQTIPNIYEELFFPEMSRNQVSLMIRNSPQWLAFLGCEGETPYPSFSQGSTGHFYWRRFLFWQAEADYKIISYKVDEHFLADIFTSGFRSSLLLTIEKKDTGIMLRLDHRGFIGNQAKNNIRFFTGYWKKMFHDFKKDLKAKL